MDTLPAGWPSMSTASQPDFIPYSSPASYPDDTMAITIAIANQKGGTGKTTTAVNLAAGLALAGEKTVLIDVDPQSNATKHLGITHTEVEVKDVMSKRATADNATYSTDVENLFIVPSTPALSVYEAQLAAEPVAREMRLKQALEPLQEHLDFILIDCPPSLDLMTINALSAAYQVIVASQSEYFSLGGVSQLRSLMDTVRESINPDLAVLGIVLTMHNERTLLSREVIDLFDAEFPDMVFDTRIRRNVRLAEAPAHGQPIQLYAAGCPGSNDYHALTKEVLQRCHQNANV